MSEPEESSSTQQVCGIVMPISPIDGCTSEHWSEVLKILKEVAGEAGYNPSLVSDANEVGIIQKRIIQNLYTNDMVICDVSAKNPNVMFELGIRLAFDKPTIIIKDDKTDYSFDTAPIEHINYPRDLRYSKILKFRSDLKGKLEGTRAKFSTDPTASPFLKEFGEFHVARLETKEVSADQLLVEAVSEIKSQISEIKSVLRKSSGEDDMSVQYVVDVIKEHLDSVALKLGIRPPYLADELKAMSGDLSSIPSIRAVCRTPRMFRIAMDRIIKQAETEIPF